MEVEEVAIVSGGGATNTAVSFAKKELLTAVIAELGNDPQSLLVQKDLEDAAVETRFLVQEQSETTAVSVVLIAADGGRSIMVYRGASAMLTKTDIPLNQIETRWVHITSLGGNMDLLKTILNWAKSNKVRVSLNPGMKEINHKDKLLPLLPLVEILFLNLDEANALWGVNEKEIGAYVTVITNGAHGGKAIIDGKDYLFDALKIKKVVDTTGAGDAFASGMVSGVLYGKTYEQAINWGRKNETSVLEFVGAKKGLLTLGEINK
jgi:sugar/nucleoside kinase (ribokinase family)